jgi:4-hydroxybenzoate polyprenyltransferase
VSQIAQTAEFPVAAGKQRSFARLDFWWFPKVGPALAVAYCAAIVFRVPGWATMKAIATIAFVGLCAGTYGYLVNDIFDLEVDRRAGKSNRMAVFSPGQRFLFCALAFGLGFTPSLFLPTSTTTVAILGLEYLVLTVYSLPPFRLKSRGALGLLCDAAGAHVVANLYVLSVVADARTPATGARLHSIGIFVALVSAWELCLGLIGILVHQVEDRENDLRSGIRTLATERPFSKLRVPTTLLYLGELLAFAALCFVLRNVAPLVGIAAAVYVVLLGLKIWNRWQHYRNFGTESTLTEWWLLSHIYYEAYFPLLAALQCALLHPQVTIFAALHLAVFVPAFRSQLHDVREACSRLILGGRLELAERSSARVRVSFFPLPARRIDIADGDPVLWKVRAMRDGLAIRSRQQYVIRLEVRADKPRDIMFGVWEDHAPWKALGCCEELRLSAAWQTFSRQFTASADDRQSYLGLWLGGMPGSVELRRWSISAVPNRELLEEPA